MNDDQHPETKSTGWPHTHTRTDLYGKIMTAAREMRKQPAPAENALWQRIRRRQIHNVKFRRQHSIAGFIVDFVSIEHKLIIEVDGAIHEQTDQQAYDAERQAILEAIGFRVLRFTNAEVLQATDAVAKVIGETLNDIRHHMSDDSGGLTSP